MRSVVTALLLAACGSSPPPAPEPAAPGSILLPDAATVDAAPVDAAPTVSPALQATPASIFRFYSTGKAVDPPRLETWTLRALGNDGMVLVERMAPDDGGWKLASQTLYVGTTTDDGKTLTLALAAGADKLSLTCKREKLKVAGAKAVRAPEGKKGKPCSDVGRWVPPKMTSIDVLACKHPDFEAPMPFAAAPGVEYLYVNDDCMQGGDYRAIAADGAIAPVR